MSSKYLAGAESLLPRVLGRHLAKSIGDVGPSRFADGTTQTSTITKDGRDADITNVGADSDGDKG